MRCICFFEGKKVADIPWDYLHSLRVRKKTAGIMHNGFQKRTAQTLQDNGQQGRKRNRKAGKFCGCFLQDLLHTDFVRDQSHFFIKAECTRIAGPDIQGDMVAAIFLCKSEDMLIKKLPDMLAAVLLIHADIVNVECSDFGHQARILLVLKDTELGTSELLMALHIRDRNYLREGYIRPVLRAGRIEQTRPEVKHSRLQKYPLTDKGRSALVASVY